VSHISSTVKGSLGLMVKGGAPLDSAAQGTRVAHSQHRHPVCTTTRAANPRAPSTVARTFDAARIWQHLRSP